MLWVFLSRCCIGCCCHPLPHVPPSCHVVCGSANTSHLLMKKSPKVLGIKEELFCCLLTTKPEGRRDSFPNLPLCGGREETGDQRPRRFPEHFQLPQESSATPNPSFWARKSVTDKNIEPSCSPPPSKACKLVTNLECFQKLFF